MSMLAGMSCLNKPLSEDRVERLLSSFAFVGKAYPWKPHIVKDPHAVLAVAGFSRLWQGPLEVADRGLNAVGAGVQWRPLPGKGAVPRSTLKVLAGELFDAAPRLPDCMERFHVAALNREERSFLLATDPLGINPLYYTEVGDVLVFASHQTVLGRFLGSGGAPDWQAAMEFLVIGHCLGKKTLLRGVSALPPATRMIQRENGITLSAYQDPWPAIHSPREAVAACTLDESVEAVSSRLENKVRGYGALCPMPVTGLLSGGWDSRYLAALFSHAGKMSRTLTTQQRLLHGGGIISEKAIARDVAARLHLDNRFVPPSYRTPESVGERGGMLDFSTWFHDWAFEMAAHIPEDQGLIADGLLGDILLRGLHVTAPLGIDSGRGDRSAAAAALHERYVKGFDPYTRGVEHWSAVLKGECLAAFVDRLRHEVEEEIRAVPQEDFVRAFIVRNRTRRGITPLARLIFGSRGEVVLPFCDEELIRRTGGLASNLLQNGDLYRGLLERVHPGLTDVPATHERDGTRLHPYLVHGMADLDTRGRPGPGERGPWFVKEMCAHPPGVLMEVLHSRIRRATKARDEAALLPFRLDLEKVALLETFWRVVSN